MKLLSELCQAPGISGREQKIIDIVKRELKDCTDKIEMDSMGNVVGIKKSKNKNPIKVMIAGHMDEIGFVVSYISDSGFIYFSPLGGHIARNIQSQRVRIYGYKTGKQPIYGVIESTSIFTSNKGHKEHASIDDMYIDTGLSKKEIEKIIEVGDPIVMDGVFVEQGDACISKAFDNRIGCYVIIETMKRLKGKNLACEVYALASAQEEVGVRGAKTAAKTYSPDIGIAIDVTGAFDTPDVPAHKTVTKLGDGVAIKIHDKSTISNRGIIKLMRSLAQKHKIKHQMEILPFGGTDSVGMQMFGSGAVANISVPTRNIHSSNEIMNKNDLKACVDLLVKFIENADKCKLEF